MERRGRPGAVYYLGPDAAFAWGMQQAEAGADGRLLLFAVCPPNVRSRLPPLSAFRPQLSALNCPLSSPDALPSSPKDQPGLLREAKSCLLFFRTGFSDSMSEPTTQVTGLFPSLRLPRSILLADDWAYGDAKIQYLQEGKWTEDGSKNT